MQSSQILHGMASQPRMGLTAPQTVCSTSIRCSCSTQAHRATPRSLRKLTWSQRTRPKFSKVFTPSAVSNSGADLPAEQAAASPEGALSKSNRRSLQGIAFVAAFGAAAAFYLYQGGYLPAIQEYAAKSPLGQSGFLAAFTLIFLSELGDKTFFIAALLAMRVGKWLSFIGSVAALGLMTLISVGIGVVFKNVPDQFSSTVPVGKYLGIAFLVYFGFKTLKEAYDTPDDPAAGGQLGDAESSLSEYSNRLGGSWWQKFAEVASLIFVAEWGDRSMLATIALGAAQSPVGVASGATVGHAVATAIAVIGGSIASQYISEKTVGYIGGVLFLVFAVATGFGIF